MMSSIYYTHYNEKYCIIMASLPDEIPQVEMCNDLPVMKIKWKTEKYQQVFMSSLWKA